MDDMTEMSNGEDIGGAAGNENVAPLMGRDSRTVRVWPSVASAVTMMSCAEVMVRNPGMW